MYIQLYISCHMCMDACVHVLFVCVFASMYLGMHSLCTLQGHCADLFAFQVSMSRMRIRWRLSKVGCRSCCRWQYSQASPMLHSPLEKRMHGRRHRWGCPRLPLPPRFSGITAPTSTGTGCTGSCSGTAGAATAGAATAGAATAGAATAGAGGGTGGAGTGGTACAGGKLVLVLCCRWATYSALDASCG